MGDAAADITDARVVAAHRAARELFTQVVDAVPAGDWSGPTACADWTVADVVAHVTWGLDVATLCVEGSEIEDRSAGPGRPHPAEYLAGADPAEAWAAARARADAVLTEEAAALPAPAFQRRALPDATLAVFLRTMVGDTLCHAWDVGSRTGTAVTPDAETLAVAWAAVREGVPRREPYFGEEVPLAGDGAARTDTVDEFSRYLAWLGRTPLPPGVTLRPERPGDEAAVHEVVAAAFPTEDEARLVDALREDAAWIDGLSWMACDDAGRVVGHALLTRCHVDDAPALCLAPCAVTPELQGTGVGTAVIRACLDAARATGEAVVLVLGHPGYYPRFGFRPAADAGIRLTVDVPDGALQVLALAEGAALPSGTVRYAAPFGL